MSLAARCNHCHTVFRITGAQLAAAQGWVRCGGCSQVFDAAANLVTPGGQPLEVPTVTTKEVEPAPAPVFQAMPDIDLNLPDLGALKAEPESAAAPATPSPSAAPTRAPSAAPPPAPDTHSPSAAPTPAPDTPPAAPSPTAAASPPPATNGRALGLFLLLTLCLLLAYAARGHIAQAWPAARPMLAQACRVLGCQLPPMRQLDALRLQGSSLSRDDDSGHHQLRIQLLNKGDAPLHMPAFDFSLLDAQGEVLARRMVDASELQPAFKQLDPGVDTTFTLALDLRAIEPASIASFRVQPFYP